MLTFYQSLQSKCSLKDNFVRSETQQLITLTCSRFLYHLYTVSLLYTTVIGSLLTFFLLVCKREFFYGPRPSIDRARSPEDATSLINYAYTRASDKYYSLNRDPTGHKNDYNYAVSVDISRNITIKIFSLMLP